MVAHDRRRRLDDLLDDLHSTLDPVPDAQLAEIRFLWPHRDAREVAIRLRGGRDEGVVADGAVSPSSEGASLDDVIDERVRRARVREPRPVLDEEQRFRRQQEVFELTEEALRGPPARR